MSIATDEAERRYPIEWENFDCDSGKLSACRRAFVSGAEWKAQREPTAAEIEAAADELFGHRMEFRTQLISEGGRYGWCCECGLKWLSVGDKLRHLSRVALDAARKAVTGDE